MQDLPSYLGGFMNFMRMPEKLSLASRLLEVDRLRRSRLEGGSSLSALRLDFLRLSSSSEGSGLESCRLTASLSARRLLSC